MTKTARGNQKSVIDYMLVNNKLYDHYKDVLVHEDKEIFDISDHNLIRANFSISVEQNFQKKGKWEIREYCKKDDQSLTKFTQRMEEKVKERDIKNIVDYDMATKETADEILKDLEIQKKSYSRKRRTDSRRSSMDK